MRFDAALRYAMIRHKFHNKYHFVSLLLIKALLPRSSLYAKSYQSLGVIVSGGVDAFASCLEGDLSVIYPQAIGKGTQLGDLSFSASGSSMNFLCPYKPCTRRSRI